MKLLTLNIRHGGGNRIPAITAFIQKTHLDVLVLTEFRANANAEQLASVLADQGFKHMYPGTTAPRLNSVLVATRAPSVPIELPEDLPKDQHRLFAVRLADLDVVACYFPQGQAKRSLFEYITFGLKSRLTNRCLLIGDLNTGIRGLDEIGNTFACSNEFSDLTKHGWIDSWRSRNPVLREYSWFSQAGNGFRIDHAFCSPELDRKVNEVRYDHEPRRAGFSDHSALFLKLGISPTLSMPVEF